MSSKPKARLRSNETKLSHRLRKWALLRSLLVKPSESYLAKRPAVGCSVWLGVLVTPIIISCVRQTVWSGGKDVVGTLILQTGTTVNVAVIPWICGKCLQLPLLNQRV